MALDIREAQGIDVGHLLSGQLVLIPMETHSDVKRDV